MQEQKDSTTNIHRRYRHLFRLPARKRTLAYACIIAFALALVTREGLGYAPGQVAAFIVATEAILLLSVEVDTWVLRRHNKVATYRRLASLTIISNSIWLVLVVIGLVLSIATHGSMKLASLAILGGFFAGCFRALILGSLFYEKAWKGIPLAFVQPALLFVPVGLTSRILTLGFFTHNLEPVIAVLGGLLALAGIEAYMSSINKIKIRIYRPLELLQAFLNAWAAEDSTNLERFLDATSKEVSIQSRILEISSAKDRTALIVVPGVHPGPFYPIGSSNIPADIFSRLKSSQTIPMVVHSMSDHGLNLPSKSQVERYVSSLKNQAGVLDNGNTMTPPSIRQIGKASVTGIAFGSTLCIAITQAPYGMEDFPVEVRDEIESYAQEMKFKNVLVIDTHNSEGEKPNEKECADSVEASREVINELSTNSRQFPFETGIAHSSEVGGTLGADIGPAGIGLVLFRVNGQEFSLVVVDSNNSVLGYREKLLAEFEKRTGSKILELCTSDTHVTAAKTTVAKGYLALGDATRADKLAEVLSNMYQTARSRVGSGSFSSSLATGSVKTIGSEVLDDFSGLLDSASSEAKYGARILAAIVFAITIAVAIA